jgi:hypothetical protein
MEKDVVKAITELIQENKEKAPDRDYYFSDGYHSALIDLVAKLKLNEEFERQTKQN